METIGKCFRYQASDENATLTLHAPVHTETQENVLKTFQNENTLQSVFSPFRFCIVLMYTGKTSWQQGNRAEHVLTVRRLYTNLVNRHSVFAALHLQKNALDTMLVFVYTRKMLQKWIGNVSQSSSCKHSLTPSTIFHFSHASIEFIPSCWWQLSRITCNQADPYLWTSWRGPSQQQVMESMLICGLPYTRWSKWQTTEIICKSFKLLQLNFSFASVASVLHTIWLMGLLTAGLQR